MSAKLVLYGNSPLSSPYVLSVFVALEEKGLTFDFERISLERGEHHSDDYVTKSLTNRVPALCDGDFWLAESSAMTEYLEERFPPPEYTRLYPEDIRERARVRMVQALVRSDFMPIREERSTETVFQRAPVKPLSAEARTHVERLTRIASRLVGGAGSSVASSFSIADVDLSMMLQRLIANGDPMPAPLVDYAQSVWQRPSIRKWLAQTKYQG
jgi:glutathione S-transferase